MCTWTEHRLEYLDLMFISVSLQTRGCIFLTNQLPLELHSKLVFFFPATNREGFSATFVEFLICV